MVSKIKILIPPAILAAACTTTGRSGEEERPNIICFVAEDISPFLACYGDPLAETPNLDKLAAEGIRFTQMHSVSGVSAPSRNALITGMYPSSIGGNNMRTSYPERANIPDSLRIPPYECTPPPYVKCYTEYLREAGYYCTNNAKEDYQFKVPKSAWDESSEDAHWSNRPEGRPFFAIFNFFQTHESQIWEREGEPLVIDPDSVKLPDYFPDTPEIRRDIAQMYTNINKMDREVGKMIHELEEESLMDNTIIIFYADHGGPLPRGKREILESGTRVPFIIRFPDKKDAGEQNNELWTFIDIPATILSLAQVDIPDYMHGKAFLGKQRSEPREYIYAARDRMDEWFDCRRSVRDEQYQYIRNYRTDIGAYLDIRYRKQMRTMQVLLRMRDEGTLSEEQMYWFRKKKTPEELYDLQTDPYELDNLAGDTAYHDILLRLRAAHEAWVKQIDDKGVKYRNEKELFLSMWPGGIQTETLLPEIEERGELIKLTCDTKGASIVYQINHSGYNKNHWYLYHEPIDMNEGDTLSVIAHRIGFGESDTLEWICK